jgi:hypothetical protein
MAEFAVFATTDDLDDLWRLLFGDLQLIAYPSPILLPTSPLTSFQQVAHHLRERPTSWPATTFFLTKHDWGRATIPYELCETNPNFPHYWYVMQRRGTPSIHFEPGLCSTSLVHASIFSDYPYYYGPSPGSSWPRPESLKAAMTTLRRRAKYCGEILHSPSRRRAIAMPGALHALRLGATLNHRGASYGR